jgi:hypothetical protein
MKENLKFITAAGLLAALIIAGGMAYRHYSVFPLTALIDEDEMVGSGMGVTLDDQWVGRVSRVEVAGGKRSAELRIEDRSVFSRLQVGIVRIKGGDHITLSSSFVDAGAPRLQRGALIPSKSWVDFYAARYLNPKRWPSWLYVAGLLALTAVVCRRRLTRFAA